MKKSLLVVIDSVEYIQTNCYQHQLQEVLREHYDVTYVTKQQVQFLAAQKQPSVDVPMVLSALKLRSLVQMLSDMKAVFGSSPVIVYEQDTYENFIDSSPYNGSYKKISDVLNVVTYVGISKTWSDKVNSSGFKSDWCKAGIIPRYCREGTEWSSRKTPMGFSGRKYPHRIDYIEKLKSLGIPISWSETYHDFWGYLNYVSNVGMFFYDDRNHGWIVEGNRVPTNMHCAKALEVASQGCFVVRNHDVEIDNYGLADHFLIRTYKDIEEVPAIVSSILSMDEVERQKKINEAVQNIRERNDWHSLVQAIERVY